jgi:hypothetical protein
MPKSIEDRTRAYLELSCDIVQWFKDNYKETNNKDDILKVKEIYECFSNSEYFFNLSKVDRQKYKSSYFLDYVQTNIFFRKYYIEKTSQYRSIIRGWKKIEDEELIKYNNKEYIIYCDEAYLINKDGSKGDLYGSWDGKDIIKYK